MFIAESKNKLTTIFYIWKFYHDVSKKKYIQKCDASNGDFHPFSYFYSTSSECACPNQNLKSTHVIHNSHILPSLRSYQLPHQTLFYFYSFHFLGRLWLTMFVCLTGPLRLILKFSIYIPYLLWSSKNIYLKITHEISIIWIYISTYSNPSHFACCSVWCYHHAWKLHICFLVQLFHIINTERHHAVLF